MCVLSGVKVTLHPLLYTCQEYYSRNPMPDILGDSVRSCLLLVAAVVIVAIRNIRLNSVELVVGGRVQDLNW